MGSTSYSNDPMEIVNIQNDVPSDEKIRRQRAIDIKNNSCTRCHTKHCRLWKCLQKGKTNNVRSSADRSETIDAPRSDVDSDSLSEN